jgi:broad specificity phosphatase PhoE
MSLLTMVRHGQASYMAENYDKLSPMGERQARKLGEFWVRQRVSFDRVFYGPAQRHIRTGEIVRDLFREADIDWPEPVIVRDLDEFDAAKLMTILMPVLAEKNEVVRSLNEAYQAGRENPDVGLLLERLFEHVARIWASGHEHPELESWADFRARVARGIGQIRSASPKSSNVVVFTSGGPIAATTGAAQDSRPEKAMELVWVSRNSSYSEFLFSGDRFSLSSFNSIPHLDDRSLITYR